MSEAQINQRVLAWAADRAELPLEVMAKKIPVNPDRLAAWLRGDERPTFRQAQSLSAALHIPFGYLFLNEPPKEDLPIPDLRTVGSEPGRKLDTNFRDLLSDVLFKHDWFKDFVAEHDDGRREFVGKYAIDTPTEIVSADIRAVLYGGDSAPKTGSWEDHLKMLMASAERVGIWVMRSGVVGNNTSRPLSVDQFRGFAVSDPVAPLIFINGKDAKAAQIFTFAHEVAHIWLGESGVSNVFLGEADYGVHRRVERKCNAIAAEFLVPADGFRGRWNEAQTVDANADRLSRHYKVSRIVIVRRALDLGIIDRDAYGEFYRFERARWTSERSESDGGSFHNTLPVRNGPAFTKAVVNQAMSGRLLLRHAASLLNTQPSSLVNFYKKARVAQ